MFVTSVGWRRCWWTTADFWINHVCEVWTIEWRASSFPSGSCSSAVLSFCHMAVLSGWCLRVNAQLPCGPVSIRAEQSGVHRCMSGPDRTLQLLKLLSGEWLWFGPDSSLGCRWTPEDHITDLNIYGQDKTVPESLCNNSDCFGFVLNAFLSWLIQNSRVVSQSLQQCLISGMVSFLFEVVEQVKAVLSGWTCLIVL